MKEGGCTRTQFTTLLVVSKASDLLVVERRTELLGTRFLADPGLLVKTNAVLPQYRVFLCKSVRSYRVGKAPNSLKKGPARVAGPDVTGKD